MTRKMHRYFMPVDREPHRIRLSGVVCGVSWMHLGAEQGDTEGVEFWAEHATDTKGRDRRLQVFGTGWELPAGAVWLGTTQRNTDGEVWHLYELEDL